MVAQFNSMMIRVNRLRRRAQLLMGKWDGTTTNGDTPRLSFTVNTEKDVDDETTDFDDASVRWSETPSLYTDTAGAGTEDQGEDGCSAESKVIEPCNINLKGGQEGRWGGREQSRVPRTARGNRCIDPNIADDDIEASISPSKIKHLLGDTSILARGTEASQEDRPSTNMESSSSSSEGDNVGDDVDSGDEDPLEPISGEVKLVPSMFPDRPPTVFFEYPKELGIVRFDNEYYSEPLGGRRLLFKTHWERNSVKNAFFRAGFSRTRSLVSWTASWGKHPTREGFRTLNRFQKVNHFPGSWCIGRKDRLLRTLARHKREFNGAALTASGRTRFDVSSTLGNRAAVTEGLTPRLLDFSPDGFVLPADRRAWLKAVEAEPRAIWIVKPPASSCGRGIRLVTRATVGSVSKAKKCLVQRYIHNPMLIDGRKFDLRLYVLVTSMEPLRIYLFEEGLVRLSTKPYTIKNLRSRFTHLTNYSINKKSGSFKSPEDSDGHEAMESTSASKWALTVFWKYLERTLSKEKSEQVKRSIEDVVLRTIAAADGDMTTHSHQATRHRGCCYELFGFDVLLDEHLKPWLLEVNISPSLFGSSTLDRRIKGVLMADIFHLVGFRPFDRTALRREERREAKHAPGTRRVLRAVAGRPQDAWRRCQTPASIKLGELGEDEWEVIRDTEDEKHRAGHFRTLYPTAENVTRLWSAFRSHRFLNGILAQWVLTGGLSNPSNRADIGLTAERLATLKGPICARVKDATRSTAGAADSEKPRAKVVTGSGGTGGEGRCEETTSNATTVISTRGCGVRTGRLDRAMPWLGAEGARPASSATSCGSEQSLAPLASRRIAEGTPAVTRETATSTKMVANVVIRDKFASGGGARSRSGREPEKKPVDFTTATGTGVNSDAGKRGAGERSENAILQRQKGAMSRFRGEPWLTTLSKSGIMSRRICGVGTSDDHNGSGPVSEFDNYADVGSEVEMPCSALLADSQVPSCSHNVRVEDRQVGNGHPEDSRRCRSPTYSLSKSEQRPKHRARPPQHSAENSQVVPYRENPSILARVSTDPRAFASAGAGVDSMAIMGTIPATARSSKCSSHQRCPARQPHNEVTNREPLPPFAATRHSSHSTKPDSATSNASTSPVLSNASKYTQRRRTHGTHEDSDARQHNQYAPGVRLDSRVLKATKDGSTSRRSSDRSGETVMNVRLLIGTRSESDRALPIGSPSCGCRSARSDDQDTGQRQYPRRSRADTGSCLGPDMHTSIPHGQGSSSGSARLCKGGLGNTLSITCPFPRRIGSADRRGHSNKHLETDASTNQ